MLTLWGSAVNICDSQVRKRKTSELERKSSLTIEYEVKVILVRYFTKLLVSRK